jgi:diamine N-acetyltransferase
MEKRRQDRVVFRKGRKTVLRPLCSSDVPLLMKWINDPEVQQYILGYLPAGEEAEKEWVKKAAAMNPRGTPMDIVFMIETLSGKPIGTMGLHQIDWKNRNATTGTLIGEKRYWGKGFGTDAKLALLEYAFNHLGLHKINSSVIEYNDRSRMYSLKCGYKVEGRRKSMVFVKGRFWDVVLLGVLKEDFEKIWKLYQKTGNVR